MDVPTLPDELWQEIVDHLQPIYTQIDKSTEFNKIHTYVCKKANANYMKILTDYHQQFNDRDIVKIIDNNNNPRYFVWEEPPVFKPHYDLDNEEQPYINLFEVFPSIYRSRSGDYNRLKLGHNRYSHLDVYKHTLILHERRELIINKRSNYSYNIGNIVLHDDRNNFYMNDMDNCNSVVKVYKNTIQLNNNQIVNKTDIYMVYSNTDTTITLAENYHKNNIQTDRTRYNDKNPKFTDETEINKTKINFSAYYDE